MAAPDRYTCEEVFRRLDDFLDRDLTPEEALRVQEHLAICAACAAEYQFESQVIALVRDKIKRISVPASLMERLHRALDAEE